MKFLYSEFVASRFEHPVLALVALAGLGLLGLGYVSDLFAPGLLPGFLGVYGVLFLTVTAFGYVALFVIKVISTRHSGAHE